MGTTEQLAKYVAEAKFEDFPKEAVERAKELFIDFVGAALGGSTTRLGKIIVDYVRDMKSAPEAGVIGGRFKATMGNAAWTNTFTGHVLELESIGIGGRMNPTPLLAVALVVGQKMGASGKDVLTGYILAQEIQGRIGIAALPSTAKRFDPFKFMFFGCAAGASKLMKLNAEETARAFGFAASQAGGGLSINSGTVAHTLDFGTSTRAGIEAAILAKKGLSSRTDVIEAPQGFGDSYLGPGDYDLAKMTKDLGKDLAVIHTTIKKYPSCYLTHFSLDTVLKMMKENNLSYDDIVSVENHINKFLAVWLHYEDPQDEDEARFSLPHELGTAILKGQLWLDDFTPEAIKDPKHAEARKKVKVVIHPEWPADRASMQSIIKMKLKDGRELEQKTGGLAEPTREQILAQYKKLVEPYLNKKKIEQTTDMLVNMEKMKNISELMEIVTL